MGKENLTHHMLAALKVDKRTEIFDEVVKGLGVRVSPSSSKTFFYRYRINGNLKRFKIGTFPGIGLAAARDEARALKVEVTRGNDPQLVKAKKKAPAPKLTTFTDLCDRFKARHLPTLRKSTRLEYNRIIDKELIPLLGKKPATEVSRKEIVDLLDTIAIDGGKPTLSNRVRAVLSSIFSFGIDKAILDVNPVLYVKRKKKETKRDRVYSLEELKTLWKAFEEQDQPVQSVYKLLLICGQRSGETRRMKWSDVDFNKHIWRIPEEETKANRTHIVPLPEMAIEILNSLKQLSTDSEYVFQSPLLKNQPVKWLQKASDRIKKFKDTENNLAQVSDFRVHDLRRSMASYLAELGTNRTVLGKILNHKGLAGDDQVTAIYDRYDYMDEKRKALNIWNDKLKEIIEGNKTFKIHTLGK